MGPSRASVRRILHITNGDSAIPAIRDVTADVGLGGTVVPWRDVLHEGPVPGGLSVSQLARVRAAFVAERDWAPSEEHVLAWFNERDELIGRFRDHDKVILWFEHDLYDQLQLLQILDRLAGDDWGRTEISLIGTDDYLGCMSPAELAAWVGSEKPLTDAQLDVATRAWSAFRSDSPKGWESMLGEDTSSLPYLGAAIRRLLEEYPSAGAGVSRTERQALAAAAESPGSAAELFRRSQRAELARFLGDVQFRDHLRAMTSCSPPLLQSSSGDDDASVSITAAGREVLRGERDWLESIALDRWIGGVHLTNASHWRWNSHDQRLERHP